VSDVPRLADASTYALARHLRWEGSVPESVRCRHLGRNSSQAAAIWTISSAAVLARAIAERRIIITILAQAIDGQIVSGIRPDGRLFEIDAAGVVCDHALP